MIGAGGFDYESAVWGADRVWPGQRTIAGFRLDEALVQLPARGRLLEVGCGAGRFLRALRLARPELRLTGVDVSRRALARLAREAPEVETRPVEGERLPAADGEFDAVLALDVLEHLDEPDRMLAEIHRVLVPGGIFHLHAPCEGDARSIWRWLPGQRGEAALKRRFGGHVQRFRRRELLERLRTAGFEILRVRNSLHVLGNVADLAAFLRLARLNRRTPGPVTTGDLVAGRGRVVRGVDALLWAEARLLARIPSWSLHVTARSDARW